MKWIKASEHLPGHTETLPLRISSSIGKSYAVGCNLEEPDSIYFRVQFIGANETEDIHKDAVEFLDESEEQAEQELALASYREMHETANKLLAEKDKEIERLIGLISKSFKAGWEGGESYHGELREDRKNAYNELLEDFKTENKI